MKKSIFALNTVIIIVKSGLKSYKCRSFLLLVFLIQVFLISGCTPSPPNDIIKEAAVWVIPYCMGGFSNPSRLADVYAQSYADGNLQIEEFKVKNKYEQTINGEKYTVYDFDIRYIMRATTGSVSGSVAMIKRGNSWKWRHP